MALDISAIDAGDWEKAINYADQLFADQSLQGALKHFFRTLLFYQYNT